MLLVRQKNRHVVIQKGRQAVTQAQRQTYRRTDRQPEVIYKYADRGNTKRRKIDKQREIEAGKQASGHAGRQRHREQYTASNVPQMARRDETS